MGAFFCRRSVWVPALAAWLVFGVVLTIGLSVLTYQRYAGRASALAFHATGTTPPADMPADFPFYPGSQVVEYFTQPAVPGSEGVFFETGDSEAASFAFYRSALNQGPWHVNGSVSFPVREISCLHRTAPELSCSLVVQRARSGNLTEISFEWIPITAK